MMKLLSMSRLMPLGLGEEGTMVSRGLLARIGRRCIGSMRLKQGRSLHPIFEEGGVSGNAVDVLVMGGGVVGSALVYLLARHTNIKRLAFLSDKEEVESGFIHHLDGIIHSGETDSEMDLHNSLRLHTRSNMLRSLVKSLPGGVGRDCMERRSRMLLGLGEEESGRVESRFEEFRHFFPKVRLVGGVEISRLEPRVAYLDASLSKLRAERMSGLLLQDEYTSISYDVLSAAFRRLAEEASLVKRSLVESYAGMAVKSIKRVSSGGEVYYKVDSGERTIYSRFLVMNDIGSSLRLVKELGYCSDWLLLNMFGRLRFKVEGDLLKGVVDTMRDSHSPGLPTPVCGFPEMGTGGQGTGFLVSSSITSPAWLLKSLSLHDFLSKLSVSPGVMGSLKHRRFVERSFLRERIEQTDVGISNKVEEQILQGVRKMIPSLDESQLEQDRQRHPGIRVGHLLNFSEEKSEVVCGRSKIHTDENLILNITQPMSGTTCIGNACDDMVTICNKLGININEGSFKREVPQYEEVACVKST